MANRKPENMGDELRELITKARGILEGRANGTPNPHRRRRVRVLTQTRDNKLGGHLRDARNMLTDQQIADLLFRGQLGAARTRLDKLQKVNFVSASLDYPDVGRVWGLTEDSYPHFTRDDSERMPDPVKRNLASHLAAVNDLYVRVCVLLSKVSGAEESDWEWIPEPLCHREYDVDLASSNKRMIGPKVKPDAAVVLFNKVVIFVERQTGEAKASPEAIHDKVLGYHRYENSPERARDNREMLLLWACTVDRDAKAAAAASLNHPTKSLDEARLEEWHTKRMPLVADTPEMAVNLILEQAVEKATAARAPKRLLPQDGPELEEN